VLFLGLAAEQWRDRADRNERAAETLRRIRAEMAANRDEVKRVVDYHLKAQQQLKDFFAVPAAKRGERGVRLEGILPVQFEQTAWQLALATQALVDIDPDLSFALARIYGVQARYHGMTEGVTNAMYLRPPGEDTTAFLHSLITVVRGQSPALCGLQRKVPPSEQRCELCLDGLLVQPKTVGQYPRLSPTCEQLEGRSLLRRDIKHHVSILPDR
jgi:hypothetical protein